MRAIDERLESIEINLDDLVVDRAIVGAKVLGDLVCRVGDGLAPGGLQVLGQVVVVTEHAAGGTDLGAHVADGGLAGGADAVGTRPVVLDDGTGAALNGEHASHFKNDVLRRRPARERAGEPDADDLRPTHVEREARHHVDRVGAADTDGDHAQPASVGGVAVGSDHHAAGEGVVLEHDLVDDAAARTPEADAVLGADAAQEVVHLAVGVDRDAQVDLGAHLGGDQVVAVHGAGHERGRQTCGHELQQGHLCGGVLHGDPVGVEVVVRAAALDGFGGVVEVVEQDLFGQRERAPEAFAPSSDPIGKGGVDAFDQFNRCSSGNGHHKFPLHRRPMYTSIIQVSEQLKETAIQSEG